jgi:hypothetical protein
MLSRRVRGNRRIDLHHNDNDDDNKDNDNNDNNDNNDDDNDDDDDDDDDDEDNDNDNDNDRRQDAVSSCSVVWEVTTKTAAADITPTNDEKVRATYGYPQARRSARRLTANREHFPFLWKNILHHKLWHIVALSQLETERNYTRTTHSNLRVLVQFAFKLG